MNEQTQLLLNLIKENPDLPVVPMVDYDVVGDGYGRWLGSFGNCYVGEYTDYDERFYDDREEFEERYYNNNDKELENKFNYNPRITEYSVEIGKRTKEEYEENCKNENLLNEYLHTISDKYFKKAIIVNIDLPKD